MTTTWLMVRASGLMAYGLLALSAIWGLLLSSRLLGRKVGMRALTLTHESLSLGALTAAATHLAFAVADDYLGFGWRELLFPGAATWKRQAVALGVVAAWGLVVVSLSMYVRRFIGQKVWRALHFGALGTYAAATLHGVMAGSDTSGPAALGLYVGSAAAVVVLVAARIVLAGEKAGPRAPRAPAPSAHVAASLRRP